MKVEKSKRNFWLPLEIECMLDLIKEVQVVQGTTATTHYTFVRIANKMKRRGFPNKSPAQIRRKWFQMKSAYLCYKRGNTERLLLIPERFRSIIAAFVDREYKTNKFAIKTPETCKAETIPKLLKTDSNLVVSELRKSSCNLFHNDKFDKFLTRMEHTHKIITKDFINMQQSLMAYEQDCQAIRDHNMITLIRKNKFNY